MNFQPAAFVELHEMQKLSQVLRCTKSTKLLALVKLNISYAYCVPVRLASWHR